MNKIFCALAAAAVGVVLFPVFLREKIGPDIRNPAIASHLVAALGTLILIRILRK